MKGCRKSRVLFCVFFSRIFFFFLILLIWNIVGVLNLQQIVKGFSYIVFIDNIINCNTKDNTFS